MTATRRRRWTRRLVVGLVVGLLLPVPWRHKADSNLGLAWGLDHRLVVDGQRLDPPGRYSWLTVGRPALVAELAWHRIGTLWGGDRGPIARDVRHGSDSSRPVHVERLASAVGLRAAGHDVTASDVSAAVGGHGAPYSWIRSMAVGSSHGLMVGLATYDAASGDRLAAGRHVAGTGRLLGDGTVGTIGGLAAKASAARRAGADVLLVPAAQRDQLEEFDPGGMTVLAVTSLEDAIDQLRAARVPLAVASRD